MDFITETLEADEIRKLYERRWYREALYLLTMIDYLSRIFRKRNDTKMSAKIIRNRTKH